MKKEDFTEEELIMLKAIFKGANAIIYSLREDRYDVYAANTLFHLEEKLGIYGIVED